MRTYYIRPGAGYTALKSRPGSIRYDVHCVAINNVKLHNNLLSVDLETVLIVNEPKISKNKRVCIRKMTLLYADKNVVL